MKRILTLVIGALLLTATACKETTSTERVQVIREKPAVVAPQEKVNVTIEQDTAPAPAVIHHEKKTTTTTNSDETGSVTVKSETESVH